MLTKEKIVSFGQSVGELPGVRGVAVTSLDVPAPGEGDIDMMVYCETVPSPDRRKELYSGDLPLFKGERWGEGDRVIMEGVEIFVMYFTVDAAVKDVESILSGSRSVKEEGGFYTTGRLAMYKNLLAITEDGCVSELKALAKEYPEALRNRILGQCLDILQENENFERAVVRKEILLYHAALEDALDAYLQALFSWNRVLFPSRKRSLQFIASFAAKPDRVEERLLQVIRLGADGETLHESYELWKGLCRDLSALLQG